MLKVSKIYSKTVYEAEIPKKKAFEAEWKQLNEMKRLKDLNIYYIKIGF